MELMEIFLPRGRYPEENIYYQYQYYALKTGLMIEVRNIIGKQMMK